MTAATIEVTHLTKRYGDITAVRDLSFTVEPGRVTGFLGPNGAGKTTTLRMLTGLVAPTSGAATIGGRPFRALPRPSSAVGAVFDAGASHPGHTALDHLRVYAAMGGHPDGRIGEVLELLGLTAAAERRTRGFSTGMRQRLSLATALLGDPRALLLDEPSNGLDPEGVSWLRGFLRELADEGRTVLLSSHVLSEVQQLVDDVVVIRRGELVAAGALAQLAGPAAVLVTSPDADRLATVLTAVLAGAPHPAGGAAAAVEKVGPTRLRAHGVDAATVADIAAAHRLRVHALVTDDATLEQLFLRLTSEEASTS